MRAATVQTPIGTLAAIPFLLSMVAFGGSFYVARLTLRLVEQQQTVQGQARDAGRQERDRRIATRTATLSRDVARLRSEAGAERVKVEAAAAERAPLATLLADAERLEQSLAERREALARREAERKTLADRLAEIERRAALAAAARTSRSALDQEIARVSEEVAAAEAKSATVQREIDAKEKYAAKDLVPRGTRRQAVFVESTAEGVLLMPEQQLLETSVPLFARATFLARAKTTGYVVFLIRPDGTKAFAAYRQLLEEHNARDEDVIDFGYEPVNADWKLAYPTAGQGASR